MAYPLWYAIYGLHRAIFFLYYDICLLYTSHGGQSIPAFDFYLAKGVAKSFRKEYMANLNRALEIYVDPDMDIKAVSYTHLDVYKRQYFLLPLN